jgi:hypothetical protein
VTIISREEWERRYAVRMQERGGLSATVAAESASAAWAELDAISAAPEDDADEEMRCWENDE